MDVGETKAEPPSRGRALFARRVGDESATRENA